MDHIRSAIRPADGVPEVDRRRRLVAYSLTSGKRAFRVDEPILPEITCAAPGVLLVGERRLSMFKRNASL